jgi:hypothetical protein
MNTAPNSAIATSRGGTVDWYRAADESAWDAFVARTATGNFLHTRRFLSYHGLRYTDRSLVFRDARGALSGVLPAAVSPDDAEVVISHPGATYGGLLLSDREHGLDTFEMLASASAFWAAAGLKRLLYKSVPPHLHRGWQQLDLYALWRLGAHLVRRDLWNVIDLTLPRMPDEARRRRLRRARAAGVRVVKGGSEAAYRAFHGVLTECLQRRHGTKPVHSLAELILLQSLFPEHIALWLALDEAGACIAGEWIFDFGQAWHGQYGVATEAGRQQSAQDVLLESILQEAAGRGVRHFSFGTSTQDGGLVFNEGLFRYKASFGPGCVAHDFYELELKR